MITTNPMGFLVIQPHVGQAVGLKPRISDVFSGALIFESQARFAVVYGLEIDEKNVFAVEVQLPTPAALLGRAFARTGGRTVATTL